MVQSGNDWRLTTMRNNRQYLNVVETHIVFKLKMKMKIEREREKKWYQMKIMTITGHGRTLKQIQNECWQLKLSICDNENQLKFCERTFESDKNFTKW